MLDMLPLGAVEKKSPARPPGPAGPAPPGRARGLSRLEVEYKYEKDLDVSTLLNNGYDNVRIIRYVLIIKKVRDRPQY